MNETDSKILICKPSGGEFEKVGYNYKFMNLGDICASTKLEKSLSTTGNPIERNPEFPIENDRWYEKEGEIELNRSIVEHFKPHFLVNSNPDASSGPPIVAEIEGKMVALSGNRRLLLVSQNSTLKKKEEDKTAYKEYAEFLSTERGSRELTLMDLKEEWEKIKSTINLDTQKLNEKLIVVRLIELDGKDEDEQKKEAQRLCRWFNFNPVKAIQPQNKAASVFKNIFNNDDHLTQWKKLVGENQLVECDLFRSNKISRDQSIKRSLSNDQVEKWRDFLNDVDLDHQDNENLKPLDRLAAFLGDLLLAYLFETSNKDLDLESWQRKESASDFLFNIREEFPTMDKAITLSGLHLFDAIDRLEVKEKKIVWSVFREIIHKKCSYPPEFKTPSAFWKKYIQETWQGDFLCKEQDIPVEQKKRAAHFWADLEQLGKRKIRLAGLNKNWLLEYKDDSKGVDQRAFKYSLESLDQLAIDLAGVWCKTYGRNHEDKKILRAHLAPSPIGEYDWDEAVIKVEAYLRFAEKGLATLKKMEPQNIPHWWSQIHYKVPSRSALSQKRSAMMKMKSDEKYQETVQKTEYLHHFFKPPEKKKFSIFFKNENPNKSPLIEKWDQLKRYQDLCDEAKKYAQCFVDSKRRKSSTSEK